MSTFMGILNVATDLFTIVASGIAIYLFIFKREPIITAVRMLLNYSFQLSLHELKVKIEKLNDYNANEEEHISEIINIFSEIEGHIQGNSKLNENCKIIMSKIIRFLNNPRYQNEPAKRSIVSELRETIRNLDIAEIEIRSRRQK